MDPRLAEIYGTNEEVSDVEKTAAAELAEKLAGEEQTDLDGLTDEDVEALAQEVLSSDEEAPEGEEEEGEKTASEGTDETEEKVAEADYIGRVMAHAYVQELKSIEKSAAGDISDYGGTKQKKTLRQRATKVGDKLKNFGSEVRSRAGSTASAAAMEFGRAGKGKKALMVGAPLAAAGGAAAAYKKLKGGKKKHSAETPALDTLAQQRALEILKENGVELESQEKQAGDEAPTKWDVLSQAVEQRAMQMLQEEGYEFEGDDKK